ncbi:hypothetical protein V6617_10010 [Pelagibacterium nitratireducens]|uniref:Uncharacterized protein n=1 Tax=Pelagibacterium nitratireducens TaxID=1046114 RepID=A0ABZ2HWM6_9HYPH
MNIPTPPAKLIVVMAFEGDGEGGMRPAFEPREHQSEQRAKIEAGSLINTYPAVIAWAREARPDIGEYGAPEVLFSFGPVPDMD